jgi:hypothetical protein
MASLLGSIKNILTFSAGAKGRKDGQQEEAATTRVTSEPVLHPIYFGDGRVGVCSLPSTGAKQAGDGEQGARSAAAARSGDKDAREPARVRGAFSAEARF